MIKKALLTVIAAGALPVPLAGMAWAEPPSDPGSTDNGIGKGGMPEKLGNFVATGVTPSAGSGDPIPPGQEFNAAKDLFPGVPTPTAIQNLESYLWGTHTLADGTVIPSDPDLWQNGTPGLALKPLTPGCNKGTVCSTRLDEVRRLKRTISCRPHPARWVRAVSRFVVDAGRALAGAVFELGGGPHS